MLTDYEWQAIELSLKVSITAVIFSLPLGILAAWVLVRCRFPGKSLLDSIIYLPLVLPPVVIGYLLLIGMGRTGIIGQWLYEWFGLSFSWRGAALASAVIAFPLMVRAIRLALEAVDTRLELAARTLGEFGATITFVSNIPGETRTIPSAMYTLIQTPGAGADAVRLCVIAILLSMASLLLSEWLTRWGRKRLGV